LFPRREHFWLRRRRRRTGFAAAPSDDDDDEHDDDDDDDDDDAPPESCALMRIASAICWRSESGEREPDRPGESVDDEKDDKRCGECTRRFPSAGASVAYLAGYAESASAAAATAAAVRVDRSSERELEADFVATEEVLRRFRLALHATQLEVWPPKFTSVQRGHVHDDDASSLAESGLTTALSAKVADDDDDDDSAAVIIFPSLWLLSWSSFAFFAQGPAETTVVTAEPNEEAAPDCCCSSWSSRAGCVDARISAAI
jgi:hypothetical protein